jgi:arylsulfatase A-like enzyme
VISAVNCPGNRVRYIPKQFLTLAEAFKSNGYQTAGFVSTPMLTAQMQYDQGFDTYRDFTDRKADYIDAPQVVDEMLGFLARRKASAERKPFFIYAHFEEPHPPWRAASPWAASPGPTERPFGQGCTYVPTHDEFERELSRRRDIVAAYDGAILSADRQIGRVVAQLKRDHELDDTIIAIATDHGLELLDRYSATHGFNPFDEVVRGFLVLFDGGRAVRLPRNIRPAGIQARIIDLAPTLIDLAGLKIPEQFEGVSLVSKPEDLPQYAFTEGYDCASVRSMDYKLIYIDFEKTKIPRLSANGFLLFDLRADPRERHDVQAEKPDVFERMQRRYLLYRNDLKTKFVAGTSIREGDLSPETLKRLKSLGYIH